MKKVAALLFLFSAFAGFSQKDSLQLGDKYLEDQLYISATFNRLTSQPAGAENGSFSYGISAGFIKDIPFNKENNFGLGIGVGYGFDLFNYSLKVEKVNNNFTFQIDNSLTSNNLRLHSIEFPIEIRWRTSTAKKYDFWRIYTGIKTSYNFSNKFSYIDTGNMVSFSNISNYNTWQTGLTLSAGYGAFNFFMYYGLTPVLKGAFVNESEITSKIVKFGLVFYIL